MKYIMKRVQISLPVSPGLPMFSHDCLGIDSQPDFHRLTSQNLFAGLEMLLG
jgi:hypothetical protein